jgi:hypothetical protein
MLDLCPVCGNLTADWAVIDTVGNMCCVRCYDATLAAVQQLEVDARKNALVRTTKAKTSKSRKGKT